MSSSSLRVERLKEIQAVLGEPDLSIKEPHSIRWLGLKNAVDVVYASYSSILATLSTFAEESPVAKGVYKYFSDCKSTFLVAFMLDVYECLCVLC